MALSFEWDPAKAAVNLRKHGISFDLATTAFRDPFAFIFYDPDHSLEEHREIIIGHSATGRLILACFAEREQNRVRIFSARNPTAYERKQYEENYKSQGPIQES